MKRKKILIIGSKGFIGSHAIDYFQGKKDCDVWGCDVVVDYENEQYYLIDVTRSDFNFVFQNQSFDFCVNCSGAASVPDSIEHPSRDFALNTYNVFKILDAIRAYNPDCKFMNLSSAAVYGNPKTLPVAESQPCNPVSPYGHHKKMAEEICHEFYQIYGVQSCCLRIFSAFGPGLKKQLLWDLYKKSIGSQKVQLFGSGKESRDFIFVDDIINALKLIIDVEVFPDGPINVASGKEIRIKDVVQLFFDLYNPKIQIEFTGNARKGDPSRWQADISRLTGLGFEPRVNIEEGIKKYVKWLAEKE